MATVDGFFSGPKGELDCRPSRDKRWKAGDSSVVCQSKSKEVNAMLGAMLVVAFLILVGPLSYFFGVDSRLTAKRDREWWPARPRR
jgi:hypothetical protein